MGNRPMIVVLPVVAVVMTGCILQLVAIGTCLVEQSQLPALAAWAVAYVVAFVPIVGSVAGATCAVLDWGWLPEAAATVFVLPQLLVAGAIWMDHLRGTKASPSRGNEGK